METLASFYDYINSILGISTPGELIFHPAFLGFCIIAFIYFVITGMRYFALCLGGLVGGAAVVHYLYPSSASNLTELIKFVGAMGVLALILVYIGFVKD